MNCWNRILTITLAVFALQQAQTNAASTEANEKQEPLYWVAPMDPAFRSDKPGKSPMGMDLVPVYSDDMSDHGTVRISPGVQHNLGVKTSPVRIGQLSERLPLLASVKINEENIWHAYPRVEGWINRLHVTTEGEAVNANDPLYEIYSPALVSAQEEYVSALESGNRSLVKSAETRLRTLGVTATDISQVKKNREVLQNILVTSPQKGIVSMLTVREGHYVTPGTAILEIADLDNVWVTAEVFENDVASVSLGDELELKFDYLPTQRHKAKIDFISPVLDAVTRTLHIRASVPNTDGRLKPNMFGSAILNVSFDGAVVLVPRQSVIRTATQNRVVLAMNDNGFKSVEVQLGRVGSDEIEITKGLRAGDTVVTSAQFLIDSESSLSSDFRRMDLDPGASPPLSAANAHSGMDHSAMDHSDMDHSNTDQGTMNHSNMDHSTMDHSNMDQSATDHSTMDHSKMDHSTMNHGDMDHSLKEEESSAPPPVWTTGVIRQIDPESKTISLIHDPIPEWGWPTMTMTMDAGADIDLKTLVPNGRYRLHIMQAPDSSTGYVVMHTRLITGAADQ